MLCIICLHFLPSRHEARQSEAAVKPRQTHSNSDSQASSNAPPRSGEARQSEAAVKSRLY